MNKRPYILKHDSGIVGELFKGGIETVKGAYLAVRLSSEEVFVAPFSSFKNVK